MMTFLKSLKSGACLAALLSGQAALADVTAQEVWENWKQSLDLYGENGVTIGEETVAGDTVTVSNVAISFSDDEVTVTGDMGEIVFTENGDGTVSIAMAESFPMEITDATGVSMRMSVTNSGLQMVASGTPDAISYDLSADQYAVVIDEFVDPNDGIEGEMRFTLNGIAGQYIIETGPLQNIDYRLNADSLDLLVDMGEPGGQSVAVVSGKIDGLYVDANIQMPEGADFENSDTLFADGFAIAATYGLASGSYLFEIDADGQAATGTASTGASDIEIAFGSDGVLYDVLTKDIAVAMTEVPDFPFPIDLTLAEYGITVQAPLSATDEPEDVALGINLTDLAINDELYMLFDPSGILPREPATVRVDLTGAAKLFFDVLDPEQADAMAMADMPGELESVTLNELTVKLAGASIDGTGDFTFDNSDLQTFDGLPRPEGEVTLVVKGANGLIDKLVQMGLVPEDQAMMSRMMVGMFARATGDDELTSTIEINEAGNVFANGQQIR